jgi:hypothetical protein
MEDQNLCIRFLEIHLVGRDKEVSDAVLLECKAARMSLAVEEVSPIDLRDA